jgi:hypothetical protein
MRWLTVLAVCACGRIAFDTASVGDGATALDDGVAPAGLVLHAAFDSDGQLLDRARGHTMTCSTCPTQVQGRIGEAAAFDLANCVLVADGLDLQPATFTLAAWALSNANNRGAIFSRPLNATTTTGNTWMFYVAVSGGWRLEYNSMNQFQATVSANTWHHLAATYDGATLTAYLDGSVVAGRDVGNLGNRWDGQIDDVRLYERVLSPDEIAALAAGS